VRVVEDGRLLKEPWFELPVFVQTESFAVQELGLVTIAADPEVEDNGYVYIYYTEQREGDEGRTIFARLREAGGKGTDLTPLVTIDLAPQKSHIAGGIAFQGDAILLGVGDHEDHTLAPLLASPAGKVLRIDRDGDALDDNPFADREGADRRIYAYGLRNPFGVTVDAVTGKAYITENRDVAGDAVYELVAGADYGWPSHREAFRTPLVVYDRPMGLAGITAYRGDALPLFAGDLLYCSFHVGGALHWLEPEQPEGLGFVPREQAIALGCSSGVTVGADGFIYYLDFNTGRLLRISRS
jgi:glucose/arabinose dehydrogenase